MRSGHPLSVADMGYTQELASTHRIAISKMSLRSRFQGYRSAGFFRSYFILGILGLSIVFFLYFNWVTQRLKQQHRDFSMMLAVYIGWVPSIDDKETSDRGKAIIEELKFPYIITTADDALIAARGIGDGLREKIRARTLTLDEKRKVQKLITEMDRGYQPIQMKAFAGEEGRKTLGYMSTIKRSTR